MLAVLPDPPAAQSFFFFFEQFVPQSPLLSFSVPEQLNVRSACRGTARSLSSLGSSLVLILLAGRSPRRRSLHPQTAVAQNGRNPNCSQELALLHNNQVTCVEQRSQCPLTQDQKTPQHKAQQEMLATDTCT